MIVWDKGPMGMGWHYRRSYETVLVAQKGKGKTRWYDDTHRIENIIRPGDHGIRKIDPNGRRPSDPEAGSSLAEHFTHSSTPDPASGTRPVAGRGWVGLAALKLDRRFLGIELDPEHAAIARRRLAAVEPALCSA